MDSCFLGDHITKDQIHTDITARNIVKPQQKYRFGTASNNFMVECEGEGGLNFKTCFNGSEHSPFASVPHAGFLVGSFCSRISEFQCCHF